jgi:hypothetical protein
MSKPGGTINGAMRVVVSILVGFIAFIFTFGSIFILFFVPVITWYVWHLNDRSAELERRLNALEGPTAKKPEGST